MAMNKNLILAALLTILFSIASMAQEKVYQLSSHILDINAGQPATGVTIQLSRLVDGQSWQPIDAKTTDANGRVKEFLEKRPDTDNRGIYKLTYLVGTYFEAQAQKSFYPFIEVVFEITDNSHYHVPITLSPYGYSTYRGN